MLKNLLIIILFLSFGFSLNAQIDFTLTVSSRNIGVDEQLYAEYKVNGSRENAGAPLVTFNDWNVISGPNTSSSISIVNGKRNSSIAYSFVLSPKRKGTLLVPSAELPIDGKMYKSNEINVNVSGGTGNAQQNPAPRNRGRGSSIFDIFDDFFDDPSQPPTPSMAPGQSPESFMKENNFVKVTPSKTTCYIGEPILVTYEFYSGMVAAAANVTKQPSFNGASVIEMTEEKQPYKTTYNGREYLVSRIRQAQIIPLKTGTITLEPAEVKVEMMKNDAYGLSASRYATIIKNQPVNINVQPLPPGAPAGFNGNVGQFSISTNVDRTNLPAGETNYLTIKISGSGNIDGIKYPDIHFPNNIQIFPYADSQSVDKQIFPMQATKIFKVPFIGQSQGNAIIPAITFSFFDNQTNEYKTTTSNPINIQFSAPLNSGEYERTIDDKGYAKKDWIFIVAALALLVIIGLFFLGRKNKNKKSPEKIIKPINPNNYKQLPQNPMPARSAANYEIVQKQKENLQNELADLYNSLEEKNFYSKAKNILFSILKTNLNTDTYSEYLLMEEMNASAIDENLKNDFKRLLDKINKGSYLPIVNLDERKQVAGELKYLASLN